MLPLDANGVRSREIGVILDVIKNATRVTIIRIDPEGGVAIGKWNNTGSDVIDDQASTKGIPQHAELVLAQMSFDYIVSLLWLRFGCVQEPWAMDHGSGLWLQ